MEEMLPLLSVMFQRTLDSYENEVERVLKNQLHGYSPQL